MKKVLVLASHCDDIELGMGATLYKHQRDWGPTCVTFTHSSIPQVNGDFPAADLREMSRWSLRGLGILDARYHNYTVSGLRYDRQSVYADMVKYRDEVRPDIVFTQESDEHQDHECVFDETLRCFRNYTIIAFQPTRHSNPRFLPNLYEELRYDDVDAKVRALAHYDAVYADKSYMQKDYIISEARVAGINIGIHWGEAFRVVKMKNL